MQLFRCTWLERAQCWGKASSQTMLTSQGVSQVLSNLPSVCMPCDPEHHHLCPAHTVAFRTVAFPISELEVTGIQNSKLRCVLKSYLKDIRSVMSPKDEKVWIVRERIHPGRLWRCLGEMHKQIPAQSLAYRRPFYKWSSHHKELLHGPKSVHLSLVTRQLF